MTDRTPPPVTITMSSHGTEIRATLPWDADYELCLDTFAGIMVALGFPNSLQDICNERSEAEEILDEQEFRSGNGPKDISDKAFSEWQRQWEMYDSNMTTKKPPSFVEAFGSGAFWCDDAPDL